MKVYSIINENAQITNATDLANAFNLNQWNNIFGHFLSSTPRGQSVVGSTPGSIRALLRRMQEEIGKEMPDYTNEYDWNARARQYGMNTPSPDASFQTIYQHLASHAATPLTQSLPDLGSEESSSVFVRTPESFEDLMRLVDTDITEFENRDTLLEFYTNFMSALVARRNEEWNRKFDCRAQDGERDHIIGSLLTRYWNSWVAQLPVTKQKVVTDMYNWLRRADQTFARAEFCPEE